MPIKITMDNNTAAQRRAENDKKVAKDIREYGCHVISVVDPEGKQPHFTYSVGIYETSQAPEAIVVGLRPELGAYMVNEYNRRLRAGEVFHRGQRYEGFLEGFSVYIEPARQAALAEYTLGCERYYKGAKYPTVQIVWPTTAGVWPWQAAASDWFRENQPMLGRKRPDRR